MLKIEFKNNLKAIEWAGLAKEIKWVDLLKKTLKVWSQNGFEDLPNNGILEVSLVSEKTIQQLNKEFRGKDKVTDVLSFSFLGEEQFPTEDLIGQIVISPKIAKKQAVEHGVSVQEEIEYLFVHGTLHVFGLDHETPKEFLEMFKMQSEIIPGQKWKNYSEQIFEEHFGKGEL